MPVTSCEAAHALQNTEGFNVSGLTMAEVRSMSEVEKLLRFGAANRTVSSTRMNQHSSRSHQVLTVYLTSKDKRTGVDTFPVLLRTSPLGVTPWPPGIWLPIASQRGLQACANSGCQAIPEHCQLWPGQARPSPILCWRSGRHLCLSPGRLLRQPLRLLPCRRGGAWETAPD